MHLSTKQYGHDIGLSCCFRQWRAKSHCSKLHGYAIAVKFVFAAETLDENNWVVDFGGLKPLKAILEAFFDHRLLVAHDDPFLGMFLQLELAGVADVIVVPQGTGCEMFAQLIFEKTVTWLRKAFPHTRLVSVEVKEHGANSAIKLAEGASLPL